jgi:hypothetical protein
MLGLRRIVGKNSRLIIRQSRWMSSTIDNRERGEEANYFAREDRRLQAEMKEKMEKILAMEDHTTEKQELVDLLNKEEAKKDQSFLEKCGLNDWKLAVPLGILLGIPMVANEVIIVGPEAQLAGCFVLFCTTLYSNVGPVASKFFDDYRATIAKDLANVDNSLTESVQESIQSTKLLMGLESEVSALQNLRDDVAIVQADVMNHMNQHQYRDAVVKKLEALVSVEETTSAAIRKRMLTKVSSDVMSTFKNDQKVKDKALEHAISVLVGGMKAKRGKDVVGEVFGKAISSYRDAYSKTKPEDDPIIVNFEKEIAQLSKDPELNFHASNVYESHPINAPIIKAAH